jgi:superoxide dismutase
MVDRRQRADHVEAWFNLVGWDAVAQRYDAARRG